MFTQTYVSRHEAVQLAVLTVPTEVSERGTTKTTLTSRKVETRESAVSKRTHKLPSLQQRIYEHIYYTVWNY